MLQLHSAQETVRRSSASTSVRSLSLAVNQVLFPAHDHYLHLSRGRCSHVGRTKISIDPIFHPSYQNAAARSTMGPDPTNVTITVSQGCEHTSRQVADHPASFACFRQVPAFSVVMLCWAKTKFFIHSFVVSHREKNIVHFVQPTSFCYGVRESSCGFPWILVLHG